MTTLSLKKMIIAAGVVAGVIATSATFATNTQQSQEDINIDNVSIEQLEKELDAEGIGNPFADASDDDIKTINDTWDGYYTQLQKLYDSILTNTSLSEADITAQVQKLTDDTYAKLATYAKTDDAKAFIAQQKKVDDEANAEFIKNTVEVRTLYVEVFGENFNEDKFDKAFEAAVEKNNVDAKYDAFYKALEAGSDTTQQKKDVIDAITQSYNDIKSLLTPKGQELMKEMIDLEISFVNEVTKDDIVNLTAQEDEMVDDGEGVSEEDRAQYDGDDDDGEDDKDAVKFIEMSDEQEKAFVAIVEAHDKKVDTLAASYDNAKTDADKKVVTDAIVAEVTSFYSAVKPYVTSDTQSNLDTERDAYVAFVNSWNEIDFGAIEAEMEASINEVEAAQTK